ncbi:Na(+)/H(+) antiporter subunit F1 [Shouchella lehensis]|uniref:Na(+)/H(+) antiporter subunit n=1 Tax=Shouchella lehensis G1 TaxID=1246626 RepID=A0A060LRZ0_9BACI|nr:Na(+)/H(+) antiporter subunit F1 [Shouchella lehensis]AIC94016.1 Na(+)/H(+) antiporter subunit [Shouchella lehensis G1]
MFDTILTWLLLIKCIGALLCIIRVLLGPTHSDRIAALDTLGLMLIGFVGILMILQDTMAYTEVILVVAILAFIGSVALAKYLERGNLFDRD